MDNFSTKDFLRCVNYNPNLAEDKSAYFIINVAHYLGNPLVVKSVVTDSDKETDNNLQSLLSRLGCYLVDSGVGKCYSVSSRLSSMNLPSVTLSLYDNGCLLLSMCVAYNTYEREIYVHDFIHPDTYKFSIEGIIATKILSVYKKVSLYCPEDLYDIYCLSELFDLNIWELFKCINKHTERINVWYGWYGSYLFRDNMIQDLTDSYKVWLNKEPLSEYKIKSIEFDKILHRFNILMRGLFGPVVCTSWSCKQRSLVYCEINDVSNIQKYKEQLQKTIQLRDKRMR